MSTYFGAFLYCAEKRLNSRVLELYGKAGVLLLSESARFFALSLFVITITGMVDKCTGRNGI